MLLPVSPALSWYLVAPIRARGCSSSIILCYLPLTHTCIHPMYVLLQDIAVQFLLQAHQLEADEIIYLLPADIFVDDSNTR